MIQGESPLIIFDLTMTRFEDTYNPIIIYHASCRTKEYGLNREPDRFIQLRFVDRVSYGTQSIVVIVITNVCLKNHLSIDICAIRLSYIIGSR